MSWHHINTRRISLQMCLFWNDGLNQKEKQTYGIGVTKFLNYFDGHKTEYYVDADEWQVYMAGQKELLNSPTVVRTLPWEAQDYLEKQLERFKSEFPVDLKALDNEALLQLQQKVAQEVAWTNSRTWMIYLINDLIAEKTKEKLQEKIPDLGRVEHYISSFSTPLEMNDAMKQRVALLELWKDRIGTTNGVFQEKLKIHAKTYEHIPMFGFDHKPYVLADFQIMLEEIVDGEKELFDLQETINTRQTIFTKELQELNLSETDELFDLIHMLKHTVFVRDYRDTLRQKMYLLDRHMYEEIGQRLGGFSAEQITNLTNEEIEKGLRGETSSLLKIIKEREQGFLIIQNENDIKVYSGVEAKEKFQLELNVVAATETNLIRGMVACKGVARGPAKIIETNQDLGKIKPGDVMIALMTRQDFVPAMRKCVAVVTDEGGITNHAAIVCREFNLPCVVGTKIATKVFKDGDIIEVDATAGIVKKIQN